MPIAGRRLAVREEALRHDEIETRAAPVPSVLAPLPLLVAPPDQGAGGKRLVKLGGRGAARHSGSNEQGGKARFWNPIPRGPLVLGIRALDGRRVYSTST